jgi:hypothetical protein
MADKARSGWWWVKHRVEDFTGDDTMVRFVRGVGAMSEELLALHQPGWFVREGEGLKQVAGVSVEQYLQALEAKGCSAEPLKGGRDEYDRWQVVCAGDAAAQLQLQGFKPKQVTADKASAKPEATAPAKPKGKAKAEAKPEADALPHEKGLAE